MRCGIEFEYLIVDSGGPEPGRIRDFSNPAYEEIRPLLEDKPGRDDATLAIGDLGIRSGYWYLEGVRRHAIVGHVDGLLPSPRRDLPGNGPLPTQRGARSGSLSARRPGRFRG